MKKNITIAIIVLIALGFGYFLFKISPQQSLPPANNPSGYNSAINNSAVKSISAPPAFDPNTDRFAGNATAKNVFVEYSDFQCPACAAYGEILKEVPAKFPDTVFVYRYFPLTQIHANSVESAMAAEAAGAQGKYWEMHDALFKNQADWQDAQDPLNAFAQYAQSVGVANIEQFKSEIVSKKYLPAIQRGVNEALGLDLPGTPSFFFNGHSIKNNDLEGMLAEAQQYVNK